MLKSEKVSELKRRFVKGGIVVLRAGDLLRTVLQF